MAMRGPVKEAMSKDRLEAKLANLRELRNAEAAIRVPELRRALRDRSNYLVAKAAELAGDCGDVQLVPDLLGIYDGLFGADAAARDPLVRAKDAIARALRALGHRDAAPFVRGLHHVQLEPVWGKLEDAASRLRCACAHALVDTNLSGPAALRELIPHLVDEIGAVRVDTVRAISQIGGDEAALLLRLKAYTGDDEPEVIGECFAGILDREPHAAVAFIASFLADEDDAVKAEAASALAWARDPAALELLGRFLATTLSPELRTAAVVACAASPLPGIVELLFTIVDGDDRPLAATAIRALAESRFRSHARERARVAARRNGLGTVYAEAFGSETPENMPS